MNIDITSIAAQIYEDFKSSVLTAVTSEAPALVELAMGYVADEEKSLKDLAENTLNGDLSYDFVVRRLKELKLDFINSLLSIEQVIASDIQNLVSNLIGVFESILRTALLSIG